MFPDYNRSRQLSSCLLAPHRAQFARAARTQTDDKNRMSRGCHDLSIVVPGLEESEDPERKPT